MKQSVGSILEGLRDTKSSTQFPGIDILKLSSAARKTVKSEYGSKSNKMFLEVSVAPNGSVSVVGNPVMQKDGRTPYLDNDTASEIYSSFLTSIETGLLGNVERVSNSKRVDGVTFYSVLLYNKTK